MVGINVPSRVKGMGPPKIPTSVPSVPPPIAIPPSIVASKVEKSMPLARGTF